MATFAPEIPTAEQLQQQYPLSSVTADAIQLGRLELSEILSGSRDGLVAILGPCAMTLARDIIDMEGDLLAQAENGHVGFLTLHRMPPWKPRSDPKQWHGLESVQDTTEAAFRTIAERAAATANVAIEIGHIPHLERYANRLTLGWIGSRHVEHDDLVEAVALHDPSLPIGVKNGMDGSIDIALAQVQRINELRGGAGAPAILIYRGGSEIQTPEAWEAGYREALQRTAGRLIVDTAHGGEIAHHPIKDKKSVEGQEDCQAHVIQIAESHGEAPVAIISEASSADSPTDPVMSFLKALDGSKQLHDIKMKALVSV